MRNKYVVDPNILNYYLSNPIGGDASIITFDNKMILCKRSSQVLVCPDLYGVFAGFMDSEKDLIKGSPHPFGTILKEISEELGISKE